MTSEPGPKPSVKSARELVRSHILHFDHLSGLQFHGDGGWATGDTVRVAIEGLLVGIVHIIHQKVELPIVVVSSLCHWKPFKRQCFDPNRINKAAQMSNRKVDLGVWVLVISTNANQTEKRRAHADSLVISMNRSSVSTSQGVIMSPRVDGSHIPDYWHKRINNLNGVAQCGQKGCVCWSGCNCWFYCETLCWLITYMKHKARQKQTQTVFLVCCLTIHLAFIHPLLNGCQVLRVLVDEGLAHLQLFFSLLQLCVCFQKECTQFLCAESNGIKIQFSLLAWWWSLLATHKEDWHSHVVHTWFCLFNASTSFCQWNREKKRCVYKQFFFQRMLRMKASNSLCFQVCLLQRQQQLCVNFASLTWCSILISFISLCKTNESFSSWKAGFGATFLLTHIILCLQNFESHITDLKLLHWVLKLQQLLLKHFRRTSNHLTFFHSRNPQVHTNHHQNTDAQDSIHDVSVLVKQKQNQLLSTSVSRGKKLVCGLVLWKQHFSVIWLGKRSICCCMSVQYTCFDLSHNCFVGTHRLQR